MTFSWSRAASALRKLVAEDAAKPREEQHLDDGQRASLTWMAKRLPQSGVVLADEVGTGKTRIACAVVHAVLEAGGRAAVVVPHGLMHQWQSEARVLHVPPAKSFTSVRDFIEDAKTKDWTAIAPSPETREWLLMSHGFRAPLVALRSWQDWRIALPSYVRAELTASAKRSDGRTQTARLLADADQAVQNIAANIAARMPSNERTKLRARLDTLPFFRRGGNNDALINALKKESGREVVEHLLGLWLGEFDLIVIDEAHKSRGEVDVESAASRAASGTVLARLVAVLLKQPESGRRLCLTATPMELELPQWLDLLGRARSGIDQEHGRKIVQRLHDAAGRAAEAPDEGSRLDELCAAARDFTRTLAPHVTRRRRDEDPLVTSFRAGAALPDGLPHPHRRLRRVQIGWSETVSRNSPWLDVLFAAECMSQSTRGLTLMDTSDWPRAMRDAYTKLSAGHVSVDLSGASEPLRVPELGVVDDHTRGKIARTAYWYRRLRESRKRVLDGLPVVPGTKPDPDAEHPRILAAVKEIERWTLAREKVLVFGVFLSPLHALTDVLNVRQALRDADQGRPSPLNFFPSKKGEKLSARAKRLLGIAFQQVEMMRAEKALSGRLTTVNDSKMRSALTDSHKAYERLRRKVREQAKRPITAWCKDSTLLGGAQVDSKLKGALEDHLVSFVLDDFLASTSEPDEVIVERFDALTSEFVEKRLRPLLGELGIDEAVKEQPVLRQEALQRALLEDDDGRQSFHARLLQGETRWETRRYLQAAFNRPRASPWVLIAQSQVGREGLNLHESCRVVVQFHAEWNPAILEQQIGRVDRKGSLWEQRAQKWLEDGARGEPPYVEIRQLVFEGTYDAFQWDRVSQRQHYFDASLFGSLLPQDIMDRIPDENMRRKLLEAAPNFDPNPKQFAATRGVRRAKGCPT